MKYEQILWDFNGTLMDDAWLCRAVMNEMLGKRGLAVLSEDTYAEIFDFPVEGYYQRAGWDPQKYSFKMLSDEFMSGYHQRKLECWLRAGARETLAAVQKRGLPQSVISAAQESMVEELLAYYQLRDFFSMVRGLDNHHAAGKTAIGVAWIQEQDTDPRRILLIGDTVHDHEVAQAMGVDCVLVYSGHQARQHLATQGVLVIEELPQVIDLL